MAHSLKVAKMLGGELVVIEEGFEDLASAVVKFERLLADSFEYISVKIYNEFNEVVQSSGHKHKDLIYG